MNKTVLYKSEPEKAGRLYLLEGDSVVKFPLQGKVTLGREESDSEEDIQIPSLYVSAHHGDFIRMDSMCLYQDAGSLNGTYLNGEKLAPNVPVKISDGDILRIGNMEHRDKQNNVVLLYCTRGDPDAQWQRYEPENDVLAFAVGRDISQAGIALQGEDVSRQQCVFRRTINGWAVENQSRTNGTQLNGKEIQSAALTPQDVVRMGNAYAIYSGKSFFFLSSANAEASPALPQTVEPVPAVPSHSVEEMPSRHQNDAADTPARPAKAKEAAFAKDSLKINILQRRVRSHKTQLTLLKDIHLSVNTGEMVLILGGSGAGKTTFMNATMGYEPAEGTVQFGEKDIYSDFEKMKYEIGYVPQEDLLRRNDYVEETLDNAAKLRLPANVSDVERQKRVEETLVTFGLEPERDKLVGKLSGGQRKRLSIAVEYVGQPSLFFLDEPDSGLDGIMARELLENLRFIADSGKIVMVITHAPDRGIDLFDKVLVLAKSEKDGAGHLAFYGSVDEAKTFFDVTGLEAIVRRINRKDEGGDGLSDHYIEKYQGMQK